MKNDVIVSTENSEGDVQVESIEGENIENVNIESEETKEKNIEEKRFDSIGPVIGNELKSTAVLAIAIALISIILYIGWAFRKVSRPVSSFKYGIIATIALFHDVIITLGVFSVLGYLFSSEAFWFNASKINCGVANCGSPIVKLNGVYSAFGTIS